MSRFSVSLRNVQVPCLLSCLFLVTIAPAQRAFGVTWNGGAGASDPSWYNPSNWNGATLPNQLQTTIKDATSTVSFDPLSSDVTAYNGYTAITPRILSYSVNDNTRLPDLSWNQPGGVTLSSGPSFATLPFPSPNTNYVAPAAYVDPPKTTFVTGRLQLNNSTLHVNSGYLYVAQYDPNQAPAAQGPFYAGTPTSQSGQVPSRIEIGVESAKGGTLLQTGGTVDIRYGHLRLAASNGGGAGNVSGTYDFRGGYLVAGTHTDTDGDALAGTSGPRSGGANPVNNDFLGFRFGGGQSDAAALPANQARFISRYDNPGAIWTQSMIANSSSNTKSATTFEFHYGARTSNPSDRGVTPIFVENTYKFNSEKGSQPVSTRTDDRGVYLDFQVDIAPELVQVSPGTYRPEDIPLIRLFNSNETPSGNSTQIFNGVPAGGIMGGSSLNKNYTPFRLDAIGSAGAISLLTENSASSLITRNIGGHDYTWRLTYFGNIDHSGNVSRNFGSFNNNDIVLLGVSTTATPNLAGDYNRDNVVDALDYVVWRMSNGQPVSNPGDGADGNRSGTVDDLDYIEWQNNYGDSQSGSGASQAVPEPATCCIMLIAAISALAATPRKRRRA